MKKFRLDIGGPKGNAFMIMAQVSRLCRSERRPEDADMIISKMKGDVFLALGGKGNDYEGLLSVFKEEFPFVELYSTIELGIDPTLYTLYEEPEIFEL